jgi:hypothetical protein
LDWPLKRQSVTIDGARSDFASWVHFHFADGNIANQKAATCAMCEAKSSRFHTPTYRGSRSIGISDSLVSGAGKLNGGNVRSTWRYPPVGMSKFSTTSLWFDISAYFTADLQKFPSAKKYPCSKGVENNLYTAIRRHHRTARW